MKQGEKLSTILKAASVDVEPYWPSLFAKALEGVDVKKLISNIGSGVGAAPGKFHVNFTPFPANFTNSQSNCSLLAGGAAAPAAGELSNAKIAQNFHRTSKSARIAF